MALTTAAVSAWIPLSIFMASMVSNKSPALTSCPTAMASDATIPGIGAAMWFLFPASALGLVVVSAVARRLVMRTMRGCPFSSKNTFTSPVSVTSPMACRRISSIFSRVNFGRDFLARLHTIEEIFGWECAHGAV